MAAARHGDDDNNNNDGVLMPTRRGISPGIDQAGTIVGGKQNSPSMR